MTEHADRRLYATWRHPEGLNRPVGLLTRRVSDQPGEMVSFRFVYLKAAKQLDGFHNLPGLPDLYRVCESDDLFPVFRNRQMPRRRPDYAEYVSELDLDVDTDPFEVVARSEGQRAPWPDGYEPLSAPEFQPIVSRRASGQRPRGGPAGFLDPSSASRPDRRFVSVLLRVPCWNGVLVRTSGQHLVGR